MARRKSTEEVFVFWRPWEERIISKNNFVFEGIAYERKRRQCHKSIIPFGSWTRIAESVFESKLAACRKRIARKGVRL